MAVTMQEAADNLTKAFTTAAKGLMRSITPVLLLAAEAELDNTPRWRVIKRWRISRGIARLKRLQQAKH